jgi:ubiquinone/menaquinone biosynthesis C-methylase UbiE
VTAFFRSQSQRATCALGGENMSAPNNPDTDHETEEPGSFSDQDSGVDLSSGGSYSSSLRSSIFDYRQEYGRGYHSKDCPYYYPIDEKEQDRLDLQHHLCYIRLGKLFLAPISAPQNILDIGTGTGIWAINIADLYPSASVIGTDLSPIQPTDVPPNCTFYIADANDGWTWRQKFDFIHCRYLHMAVEEKRLFQESFRALKPGAWFEIKEFALPLHCVDGTLEGTALATWGNAMMEASRTINTPFDTPHQYRGWMEEAGFVNVKQSVYHLPLNTWPEDPKEKEIGRWQMANLLEGLEGFSLALFTKYLNWSREELEVSLAGVRNDLRNRSIHAYATLVCVIGQKPLGCPGPAALPLQPPGAL